MILEKIRIKKANIILALCLFVMLATSVSTAFAHVPYYARYALCNNPYPGKIYVDYSNYDMYTVMKVTNSPFTGTKLDVRLEESGHPRSSYEVVYCPNW